MGIMSEAADDAQDILDKEGEDCIFTVTDGTTVVSVTCKALPVSYQTSFTDPYGEGTISKAARITVSEKALRALGYPVRNTANRVSMKGHQVTYTDVSGEQAVYQVIEQFPNGLTGLIRLTLSEFNVSATPGRTIIGWEPFAITIQIVETPNGDVQTLSNGDEIPLQYALNDDGTLTVPDIAGYEVLTPFMLSQFPMQGMPYNKTTGTFDNSANNGFVIGAIAEVNVVIPKYAS